MARSRSATEQKEATPSSSTRVKDEHHSRAKTQRPDDHEDSDASDNEERAANDDDDEEEENGGSEAEGSLRGEKRSRSNKKGDSVHRSSKGKRRVSGSDGDEESQDDDAAEHSQVPRAKLQTLPRDPKDEYIPGSIVRVKLYNFLTYEGPVEFRPGPYMNMIIGPNGTGKSSVVCAIALGLSFSPAVLGKADSLSDFVRHGALKGWTEIELKGRPGEKNPVIKREMNSKNRASTWWLNGQVVPMKDITAKVESYNIQASNLCTFIPQERVAEFARLNPSQLLVQTEKAAGDPHLFEWHNELVDQGNELQKRAQEIEGDANELKQLEDKNRELERDVERWNQRNRVERKVKLFDLIVPAFEYSEAKTLYDRTKTEMKDAKDRLLELRDKNVPMQDLKKQYDEKAANLDKQRQKLADSATKKYNLFNRKFRDCDTHEGESDELYQKLESLKKREQTRKSRIARLEEEIESLKDQIANPPEVEDVNAINADNEALRAEANAKRAEWNDFDSRKAEFADKVGFARAELKRCQEQMRDLQNTAKRRLENLRRDDRDCADVIEWLRRPENRARFRMEVTEPAYVSLDIPDLSYVDQIEACISWIQLKTFICACEEDYKLLGHLVNDTPEAIGRKARITIWYRPMNLHQLAQAPMTPEVMHGIGFDGYAADFVSAPEGLMWFLRKELSMHRTAIAKDGRSVNTAQAIEAISAAGSGMFIAGNLNYRVTRSAYGRRLAQTATSNIRQARNLKFDAIDPAIREDLESKMAKLQETLDTQQAVEAELTAEQNAMKTVQDEFKRRDAEIKNRRAAVDRAIRQHATLRAKLDSKQTNLKTEEKSSSAEEEAFKIKKQIAENAKKRATLVTEAMKLIAEIMSMQAQVDAAAVAWLQAKTNANALDRMANTFSFALTRAMQDFEAKKLQHDTAKEEAQTKLAAATEALNEVEEDIRDEFHERRANQTWLKADKDDGDDDDDDDEYSGKSQLEIARDKLAKLKAKLETMVVRDPDVIRVFQERKRKIDGMTASLNQKRRREEDLRNRVSRIRSKWYTALTELISGIGEKFSASFQAIGCAGEIRIGEHESYDKWTLDIYVKFRDNTEMQLLTVNRQSGGERSLTTIMYLMSLCEYARTPFSLVDEINQGMDSKAERVVHNQLVRVTCAQNAGQYFLVTPKLLQNLNYHARMKVFIVCNGEGVSEDKRFCDLKGLLKAKQAQMAAA